MKIGPRTAWFGPALASLAVVIAGCAVNVAPTPNYPIPYDRPTTQSVIDDLERIRWHLQGEVPMRIVEHPTTREFAGDPRSAAALAAATQPTGPTLDRGPEWKFSPVSYAMGVAYAGMIHAGEATGDPGFDQFVADHLQFMADNIALVPPHTSEKKLGRNPFRSLLAPRSLDDCGAMGAAFIKAKVAGIGPDLGPTIDLFANFISHKQLRLDDGTLCRDRPFRYSVWGDDMYMSVPFLAQMGAMTGNPAYLDDAARQVIGIGHRLRVASTGLYTHAWNTGNPDDHPHYYWGRANGWCFMAMAELLDVLPQDHPSRPEVLRMFRELAQAIASEQSGMGLWHQMLDRPDSYLETSCSAMFTYCFARGVDKGWLDAGAYGPVAQAGWNGLTTRIGSDGHIDGTCVGTGYGDDYVFYYYRPMADDVHGYGPVLLAGSEMIHLLANNQYNILGTVKTGAIYFQDKKRDVPTQPSP
jgi:unsaturated rhamnogalacturonyl hydrolase